MTDLMTIEQEREILSKIDDLHYRNEFIRYQMHFVVNIAKRYARIFNYNSRIELDDLVNQGALGLIRALENYNATKARGYFICYAKYHVRYFISKYLDRFNAPHVITVDFNNDYNAHVNVNIGKECDLDKMHEAIHNLEPRRRNIITQRYLINGKTLRELADEYHVSTERIRQLEESAIAYLRKDMGISNEQMQ